MVFQSLTVPTQLSGHMDTVLKREERIFFLSFFLSVFLKTQPNHWTKRMVNT